MYGGIEDKADNKIVPTSDIWQLSVALCKSYLYFNNLNFDQELLKLSIFGSPRFNLTILRLYANLALFEKISDQSQKTNFD